MAQVTVAPENFWKLNSHTRASDEQWWCRAAEGPDLRMLHFPFLLLFAVSPASRMPPFTA